MNGLNGLKALKEMVYPGRAIIIGLDGNGDSIVVAYAITGRSPSSQARRLVFENGTIFVRPTEMNILDTEKTDLLIYPAVHTDGMIAVSNGKHTESIAGKHPWRGTARSILERGLSEWSYEPDAPHYTPRIGGVCIPGKDNAALGIVKRGDDGHIRRDFFEFPLLPGRGKMITTYSGVNAEPLPSFAGEPLDVEIRGKGPGETAEDIYTALGPVVGEDYRVSVGVIFIRGAEKKHFIINRCERGG